MLRPYFEIKSEMTNTVINSFFFHKGVDISFVPLISAIDVY